MSDRRFHFATERVAHESLRGQVAAPRFTEGEPCAIAAPWTDLSAEPGGARDRQLLFGEGFLCIERREGRAFGRSARDGHVGWVTEAALGPPAESTHFVCARASHAYPAPEVKAREVRALPFGARLRVVSETPTHVETEAGLFVPKPHVRALSAPFRDPVTVAQLFFGTPYLWGGNTGAGIDCSGLVQAACLACGIACPPDTDLQAAALGSALAEGTPVARGDLYFWKGHVAIAVDGETLIHANAHHMAVAYEPIAAALARIAAQEGAGLLCRRRL